MRLVDRLVRQGHLSDAALAEVGMTDTSTSARAHFDRCDLCAQRLVQLNRWLDDVRADAVADADRAFPAERLAIQQAQILRRLEQLDEPARVISFPYQAPAVHRDIAARRVSPAWIGVALAAGVVIGVVGGQAGARLEPQAPRVSAPVAQSPSLPESEPFIPTNASLLEMDLEGGAPASLISIDQATPQLVPARLTASLRTGQ